MRYEQSTKKKRETVSAICTTFLLLVNKAMTTKIQYLSIYFFFFVDKIINSKFSAHSKSMLNRISVVLELGIILTFVFHVVRHKKKKVEFKVSNNYFVRKKTKGTETTMYFSSSLESRPTNISRSFETKQLISISNLIESVMRKIKYI